MLAPDNYVQWKSRIKRCIDTKPNHELIHYCLENPPYELGWKDKEVPTSEGSSITRTERVNETYKNVSQEIRDQLNAEAKADGEPLESYYSRFYKMMKELIRNQCKVTNHQVNVQFQETYKNVSLDIRDQLNAEAEAVQIILTGIDNDIYSTVDACPNACEM
uniref:Gag-Pol polyprotein n=1 Tax=Tanacetum cinerariifolium TaxID=118510 RepID=A0A699H726_TANCI|nr:hypothetical protein [Tanacetum cinerariifolium]